MKSFCILFSLSAILASPIPTLPGSAEIADAVGNVAVHAAGSPTNTLRAARTLRESVDAPGRVAGAAEFGQEATFLQRPLDDAVPSRPTLQRSLSAPAALNREGLAAEVRQAPPPVALVADKPPPGNSANKAVDQVTAAAEDSTVVTAKDAPVGTDKVPATLTGKQKALIGAGMLGSGVIGAVAATA